VNIKEFYDRDERRRASDEIEVGDSWLDENDQSATYQVSWIKQTKEIYALREPPAPMRKDALGETIAVSIPDESLEVEVLGLISSEEELQELLRGWQQAMREPNSLAWVRERLRSHRPSHDPGGRPPKQGEREIPGA
jgi:hypothetical protein